MANRPKPAALRLLQNNPGKRPINAEPKLFGAPRCPSWLSKDAKATFKRICAELAASGMLKGVDTDALSAFANSVSEYKEAVLLLQHEGSVIKEPIVNKSGELLGHRTKRHPASVVADAAAKSIARFGSMFGLDPSSRARLSAPEMDDDEELEELLNGTS